MYTAHSPHIILYPFDLIQFLEAIPEITMPTVDEPGPIGPPPPGTQYPDPLAMKAAFQSHASDNGYAIKVDCSTPKLKVYLCSKGGRYDNKGKSDTIHKSKL
jgi:hypothetical protein